MLSSQAVNSTFCIWFESTGDKIRFFRHIIHSTINFRRIILFCNLQLARFTKLSTRPLIGFDFRQLYCNFFRNIRAEVVGIAEAEKLPR